MRFRVHIHQEIVERLHDFVPTRRELGQPRVLERVVALPHGAFHSGNRVAHHASKSGARLRLVYQFANRSIEHSAKQQRRIVTAGAPFRRLHAGNILHVFDALAIPLIVE